MKIIILTAVLLALSLATVVPRVGPIVTHVPLTYKVNIEDPPIKRWAQMAEDFKVPLKKFMDYFDSLPIP